MPEELEIVTKRKGKVVFTSGSMAKVNKPDDTDDFELAFKKNQHLLSKLLQSSKGEDLDSKISMR